MLTDGLDPRLKKWLAGTRWPEHFKFNLKLKMIKNRFYNQLKIWKGLDSMTVILNPRVLTKSDFDYTIQKLITAIEESSKITLRYNHGKAALKE